MPLPRTADDAPTPSDHVQAALATRHDDYLRALNRVRGELTPASEADELAATLREAVTLVACLRRMVKGRNLADRTVSLWIEKLRIYRDANQWPGYAQSPVVWDVPAWMRDDDEEGDL